MGEAMVWRSHGARNALAAQGVRQPIRRDIGRWEEVP